MKLLLIIPLLVLAFECQNSVANQQQQPYWRPVMMYYFAQPSLQAMEPETVVPPRTGSYYSPQIILRPRPTLPYKGYYPLRPQGPETPVTTPVQVTGGSEIAARNTIPLRGRFVWPWSWSGDSYEDALNSNLHYIQLHDAEIPAYYTFYRNAPLPVAAVAPVATDSSSTPTPLTEKDAKTSLDDKVKLESKVKEGQNVS